MRNRFTSDIYVFQISILKIFFQGALIESEKKRRLERLKSHYQNDIWKKRDKRPDNWDRLLPKRLREANQNSYLESKANDIKNKCINDIDIKIYNACSIL